MWHKTISRQQFVELVGCIDRYQPFPFSLQPGEPESPRGDIISAIWLSDNQPDRTLPDVLVIASDRINEFIAFSATFVGSLRPLSAYIRLLTPEQFLATQRKDKQQFHRVGLEAFVGAIIAEILTEIKTKASFESLSMNAFTSTYSFAMARNLWLYRDSSLFEDTSQLWFATREWTRQPARRLQKQQLIQIWAILKSFSDGRGNYNNAIVDALIELHEHGSLSSAVLRDLTNGSMVAEDLRILMSSPRDERLRFVENFLAVERKESSIVDDFLCGFFMSLISNGSMDYANLLVENLERFPTGLMWYGICGGVKREGRLDTWRRGLQHWLSREIQRNLDLANRPVADISAFEFQILLRAPSKGGLLQDHGKTLTVELLPGIEQTLAWPFKTEDIKVPEQSPEPSINKSLIAEDILAIAQRCSAILKRLDIDSSSIEPTPTKIELGSPKAEPTPTKIELGSPRVESTPTSSELESPKVQPSQMNFEIQPTPQSVRSQKDRNKRKNKR